MSTTTLPARERVERAVHAYAATRSVRLQPADVDDVTAAAWLSVWRGCQRDRLTHAELQALIWLCARSAVVDHIRRELRPRPSSCDPADLDQVPARPSHGGDHLPPAVSAELGDVAAVADAYAATGTVKGAARAAGCRPSTVRAALPVIKARLKLRDGIDTHAMGPMQALSLLTAAGVRPSYAAAVIDHSYKGAGQ